MNDVLHINGFLNAVSYSLNETCKEYGEFLDKFEHTLADVVAKMELSFARKLRGAFDEHEKVFNQLSPYVERNWLNFVNFPMRNKSRPGKRKKSIGTRFWRIKGVTIERNDVNVVGAMQVFSP